MQICYDLIVTIPDPYTSPVDGKTAKVNNVITLGILYKIFEFQSLQNAKCMNESALKVNFLDKLSYSENPVIKSIRKAKI